MAVRLCLAVALVAASAADVGRTEGCSWEGMVRLPLKKDGRYATLEFPMDLRGRSWAEVHELMRPQISEVCNDEAACVASLLGDLEKFVDDACAGLAAEPKRFYNPVLYGNLIMEAGLAAGLYTGHADVFEGFKSPRTPLTTLYRVLFGFWAPPNKASERGAACVAPSVVETFARHAAADARVGAPTTFAYSVPGGRTTIVASPVVARYAFELSQLAGLFESSLKRGDRVLEIGGGYGLFGSMVSDFFGTAHSVVDLAPVHALTRRHARAAGLLEPHQLDAQDDSSFPSDLLVSFFSISEQNRETVDAYVQRYVAFAKRGYLQLNYDNDLERGGRSHVAGNDADRYSALELFRRIYHVHPGAVFLPPPPCGVYDHHRIAWGLNFISM